MKIVFLVPDGVGIRNYLYSDILKGLIKQEHEIIIWHTLSDVAIHKVEAMHGLKLHTVQLPYYTESIAEKFLRETVSYARLRYNTKVTDNPTIMTNWAPNKKKLLLQVFYKIVEMTAVLLFSYKAIVKLEQLYHKVLGNSKYLHLFASFLEKHKPEVVFNTHQRAIRAIPALFVAKKRGIKTVSVIYSWDNLCKARLSARADYYLVWSEYMKQEMHWYYPEIAEDNITITGTPQFDFYHDKALYWNKDEFCSKYDLDVDKPIICFSGDDTRTSPYDPEYLKDLAEAITTLAESERPQILFRRCPVDLSGRYDAVLQTYREIIKVSDPLWNRDQESDSWALVYPSFEDVQLLVNIALHCDVVYNVGSTMAHDFAMFDKPAVYINYDQPYTANWSVDTIYKFQHFRSMKNLDAVSWVNSKEEIAETLKNVLLTPEKCSLDRKKWLQLIIGTKMSAANNIADFLVRN